jgi:HTH-type transcriptional regulator/antitoxin HigA
MRPKVIKTEADYKAALARLNELLKAKPETPEGDEFELWVALVETYEDVQFPIELPDPITAIRFRMEQAGLRQVDLVPYIGSRSRVSEVLNGKRKLSLSMIRRLHEGLGIPAEVLLHQAGASMPAEHPEIKWSQFPIAEMLKRGWFTDFKGTLSEAKERAEELVAPPYRPGTVTKKFCRELVHLSYLDDSPLLAQEFLNRSGIHFVTEDHLPRTHLDGAAFWASTDRPVVALTLRYDRLDNFWFTLCHELAHVSLHLEKDRSGAFVDDLKAEGSDDMEMKADAFAADVLVPAGKWNASGLQSNWSTKAVISFAERLRIHPAIVAGRIRRERDNYRILSNLVGRGAVRRVFFES